MTSEEIKQYREYWTAAAAYRYRRYIETGDERQNDEYVKAQDHIIICDLALNTLYRNEERRKEYYYERLEKLK